MACSNCGSKFHGTTPCQEPAQEDVEDIVIETTGGTYADRLGVDRLLMDEDMGRLKLRLNQLFSARGINLVAMIRPVAPSERG